VVTIFTTSLTFRNLCSAHTVYLCVLCGSEKKQRLFLCTALTDCITDVKCVCCAVRTLILNTIQVLISVFEDRSMAQTASRRPFPAGPRFRSHVIPRGICGGQSDTGTGFSEYFGFPLLISFHQCWFFISTYKLFLTRRTNGQSTGNLTKSSAFFRSRGALHRRTHLRNTIGCMSSLVSRSHSVRGV
jgi:hypothetical protein